MGEKEREQRALEIFSSACELDSRQRANLLDDACGTDRLLRARVEALLAMDATPGDPELAVGSAASSIARHLERALEREAEQRVPRSARYPIEGEIGRGGMGVVYRARDTKLDRAVAVEVLPAELVRDERRLRRFEREARMLASLNHPGIATVHDLEEAEGALLLVQELIAGETLRERLRRAALPVEQALEAGLQIACALEAAHARGIVHRDLKPQNVMLTPEGRLRVLDFGLAKRAEDHRDAETCRGGFLGTPGYMSPEQVRGEEVDGRADVWALGCVLYAALAGSDAFAGRTAWDRIQATLERIPDWDGLAAKTPENIVRLIERCLEKEQEKRPGEVADARRELEQALSSLTRRSTAARKRRDNLPRQLTSFIGRAGEAAEVKRLLGSNALVTLVGAGGCGKTRLALQVASDIMREHDDGVWLVELAALTEPQQVPRSLASVLGLREEAGVTLTQQLAAFLESKTLLLVLDNCEHLLAACAGLTESLLRACPRLRILATSRQRLGVAGERTYRVPPLALPEGEPPEAVESLLDYDAAALFAERATAASADFVLADEDAVHVTRLCQRLDGMPLALELAAARVRMLSLEQIARRLDQHLLRVLQGGGQGASPRQQTLRATLDWSHGLLSDAERTLFRRLSVFAGGFTLETAEAVCAGDGLVEEDVLDLLTRLVDKSLVEVRKGAAAARYGLLETVREYARDRLVASDERELIYRRHCDHFLALAEEADPLLEGSEQQQWMERLDAEYENLRAALRWCAEEEHPERGMRLGAALCRFWRRRGYVSEARQLLGAVLARDRDGVPRESRTAALNAAGILAHLQADLVSARSYHEHSLASARELGDERSIRISLYYLGLLANDEGDLVSARSLLEQCLVSARQLGDRKHVANALGGLGLVALSNGELSSARRLQEEALALHRELGYETAIQGALSNLGIVAYREGDLSSARTLLEQSLTLCRKLADERSIASCVHTLGCVAHAEGDLPRACALFEQALELNRKAGSRLWEVYNLSDLGYAVRLGGDYRRARALLMDALRIEMALDKKDAMVPTLQNLAGVANGVDDPRRAALLLGAADALSEPLDLRPSRADIEAVERTAATAREALGEEAFAAAWAEGRALTLEQALELAMSDDSGSEASGHGE